MLEGKRRDGNDISPSYFEDPFFKSLESAQRYSDWKDEITPNPKRKKGVPNLYINGFYHESIGIAVTKSGVEFNSTFADAADIERKFGSLIYSLNVEKRTEYVKNFLNPLFVDQIKFELRL